MKRTVTTALVLVLVCAAIWARPLFFGETFLLRDHVSATLPSRAYLAASLRDGRIPEWWPAVGLGSNFAANPNHGVTYPPAWIVALLPAGLGADVLLVLHALLGALGVAVLSRRLGAGPLGERTAGAAFAASGYVGSIFINAIPLLTLAWTPWVAAAAFRLRDEPRLRPFLLVVAAAAPQIASGDPAGMITSALVSAAIVLPRGRAFLLLVGAWLAALVVAAVAVVPALHLLAESERAGGLETATATTWSLHPLRLVSMLWPRLLGDVIDPPLDLGDLAMSGSGALTGGWALGVYLGLPVLLLAVSSGQRRLLVAALLLTVLALGRFTPLYGVWRTVFLPERLIRYPEKHIAGALVLLTALAGVGLTRLLELTPRRFWLGLAASVVLVGAALAAVTFVPPAITLPGKDIPGALAETRAGGLVALISLVALGLALLTARTRLAPFALFLALILPMVTESWNLQLLGPRELVTAPAPFLVPNVIPPDRGAAPSGPWPRLYRPQDFSLPARAGEAAAGILSHFATAVPNVASQHGIAYAPGYDPALASRLHTLWDLSAARGAGARLLSLLGVEWAVLTPDAARQARFRPVVTSANGRVVLLYNPGARPRAFATARWIVDPDEATLRERLLAREHDPSRARLIDPIPAPTADGPLVPCALDATPAETVIQRCRTTVPSVAVVLDAWAPGWSATVDGDPAPIHRIDSIARGVYLPTPGDHVIQYTYRTPGLRLGLVITLASLLVLLVLARRLPPQARKPEAP